MRGRTLGELVTDQKHQWMSSMTDANVMRPHMLVHEGCGTVQIQPSPQVAPSTVELWGRIDLEAALLLWVCVTHEPP